MVFEKFSQQKERLSVQQVNEIIRAGETVEADFVTELPKFHPDYIIPNIHDWSYYNFNEGDPNIQAFAEKFISNVGKSENPDAVIQKATQYVLENIQWVRNESSRDISALIRRGKGSCSSKAVLLAYLLNQLNLQAYLVSGYARNVSIESCPELRRRNKACKPSLYPNHLFNLPLDSTEKPIHKDVGHAWVGIQTESGMVYADPTTGLVSINPEEREIFSQYYKTIPPPHPEGEGIMVMVDNQRDSLDLNFDEPVQKIRLKISHVIPDDFITNDPCTILAGPEDQDIELKFPIKGIDIITHSGR